MGTNRILFRPAHLDSSGRWPVRVRAARSSGWARRPQARSRTRGRTETSALFDDSLQHVGRHAGAFWCGKYQSKVNKQQESTGVRAIQLEDDPWKDFAVYV